jgi:hypothetical protein
MRLMSSFVDSELAASAGFAASINFAPGIKERIAASRITLEKADHAERVLSIMSDFGADADRYQAQHDWTSRVERNADIGATAARHAAGGLALPDRKLGGRGGDERAARPGDRCPDDLS